MKIIGVLPLKNEGWILKYTLACLSDFCDEIIALDDGSTDNSISILEACPKVKQIIRNAPRSPKLRNEPKNWNRLTKEAIKRNADWIFYTDADEMLSKNIVDRIHQLVSEENVDIYQFPKLSPWRGLEVYRCENDKWLAPPRNVLNPILIRANTGIHWSNPKGNLIKRVAKYLLRGERFLPTIGRVFPVGSFDKIMELEDIFAIHFNNLSYSSLIKKQINYAVNEIVERPYKDINQIVDWAYFRLDETNAQYKPLKKDWVWDEYKHLIETNFD